jgi:hypothetical protein
LASAELVGRCESTSDESMVDRAMNLSEPLVSRQPWFAALLLVTMATPAGVVLAWLGPRPLDAVVALPLVLVDVWATSRGGIGNSGEPE